MPTSQLALSAFELAQSGEQLGVPFQHKILEWVHKAVSSSSRHTQADLMSALRGPRHAPNSISAAVAAAMLTLLHKRVNIRS